MNNPQVDNNTFEQKIMLRKTALNQLAAWGDTAVVMETHGGIGDVWSALYHDIADGVVMEKKGDRAIHLAHQRPSWAVYECDSVHALTYGAGKHLAVNLLDVDPYGSCWDTVRAFFTSERPFARRMVLVVNDGMRQKVRVGGAFDTEILQPVVQKWGNDLWDIYLDVCRYLVGSFTAVPGYRVTFFDGYYCGVELKMTHFVAVLEQPSA
jgi:hypothetical protein